MVEPHIFDTNALPWGEDPRFPGVGLKLLESGGSHPAISLIIVRIEPGLGIPTHTHPTETETAIVLEGEGLLTIGERQTVLTQGMGVTIPPGSPHNLRNTGQIPLQVVAMHSPPTR